jgi:hypothetical protein
MLMNVDFECAVRTLVRMAMAQDPGKCVTTGLIVAVLAPKFCNLAEDDIARVVISAVVEEGGAVDQVMPTPDPFTPGRRADCSGGKSVFHRVH